MIGRRVFEFSLIASIIVYFFAYFCYSEGFLPVHPIPVLTERVSFSWLLSSASALCVAVAFSIVRNERDMVSVFGFSGVLVLGGGFAMTGYLSPFIIFGGYAPSGGGFILRMLDLARNESYVVDFILNLAAALGAYGMYVFFVGFKSIFLNK